MKDIIEKNLKIISDYNMQLPTPISYLMRPPALRHPTPIPQNVREALIKLEQVLYEVTLNDSATLKSILNEFGVRLSLGQSFYGTIAHVAAQQNRDSLEVLIDKMGESVLEALDRSGQTVTSHAAKYNTKSLELLIDRFGEKVLYVKDSNGDTPLHLAATYNRDAFKLLIDKIPQAAISLFTEKDCDGDTALHVAIQNGNGDLLQPLIEKHPEITQSFLSARNIKGNTPLHFAAEYDKDFFEFLIEHFGEKVLEVKNNRDHTVLYVAAECNKDALKLLIEKFPEIIESLLVESNIVGDTALHIAAQYNKDSLALLIEKFPETIQSLLSEKNAVGRTVLHLVAWRNKDSLKLLIEKFPEVIESFLSTPDKASHTPLHLSTGNEGAFKLLIENFPEQVKNLFDVENEFGDTVLQYANSECPDALPIEYRTKQQNSCVILGNQDYMPIPGIPEAFSSYYQDHVALLLKLRLEDTVPEALKSVNVLEENYTLRERNADEIAEKLSSFILTSNQNTILMPINIGGSHLVGIAAVKDRHNVVIHYMDSELSPPPEALFIQISAILESYDYSMELRIGEVERQKYSNCGPEVIENLTSFATGTPRASQEEAILKHSLALERHLLKDSDNIHYADTSIHSSTAVFSSTYAMLDEKLLAQLQHYLSTGEAFDTVRAAIDEGTVHITRQSIVISNEEVANSAPLSSIQTYNADSYYDLEALYPTADFSPDINMVAIIGLLCSFVVSH